jgi:hypothetical protein
MGDCRQFERRIPGVSARWLKLPNKRKGVVGLGWRIGGGDFIWSSQFTKSPLTTLASMALSLDSLGKENQYTIGIAFDDHLGEKIIPYCSSGFYQLKLDYSSY